MKKIFLITLLSFICSVSRAQLDVNSAPDASNPFNPGSWLRFTTGGTPTSIVEFWGLNLTGTNTQPVKINNTSLLVGYTSNGAGFGNGNAYISGSVGIGTTNPGAKFDVSGNVLVGTGGNDAYINIRGFNGSSSQIQNNSGLSANYNGLAITSNANNANNLPAWTLDLGGIDRFNYNNFDTYSVRRNNIEQFRITSNGNVGIGTTSPDQKLTVNGTIHASQVKVDTSIPVPDYVFKSGYRLKSLQDVKAYIDKNQHLPEIPSASQQEKEGVDLGKMNQLLLKKVEELTLYLIEEHRTNMILKFEIKTINKKLLQQPKTNAKQNQP
ncbi:hypothetical protein MUY27_03780 [Mucilaginibacter sp. RS28]|uniref:Peptidase S74 domain-containing protein n=1 Tax=Mucilaginibacter straminoryzae TaxID=2932774 RepID=A0A9X1X3A4_9SPHI|nr:hypothetical protein [Mucilaginibacter straminoryzae]MCJ8208813.1 hypothetical protein [Mucilaginibacter straminoryzae]